MYCNHRNRFQNVFFSRHNNSWYEVINVVRSRKIVKPRIGGTGRPASIHTFDFSTVFTDDVEFNGFFHYLRYANVLEQHFNRSLDDCVVYSHDLLYFGGENIHTSLFHAIVMFMDP